MTFKGVNRTRDLKFGQKGEEDSFVKINDYLKEKVIHQGGYNVFDYYSDSYLIELKTRRNNYSAYPTTMIPMNKIRTGLKDEKKKMAFFFNFTDGLYCWHYDEDEYLIQKGGRWDRGVEEIKDYAYIPIDKLIKV